MIAAAQVVIRDASGMGGRDGAGAGDCVAEKGRLRRGSGVAEEGRGVGVDERLGRGGVGAGLMASGGMPVSPGRAEVK